MVYNLIIVFLLIFILGYAGGMIAKNNGRSFFMGAVIAIFLNIPGLFLLTYIGSQEQRRSFNPDFKNRINSKAEQIKQMNELHEEGKISDKEFNNLKMKLLMPGLSCTNYTFKYHTNR